MCDSVDLEAVLSYPNLSLGLVQGIGLYPEHETTSFTIASTPHFRPLLGENSLFSFLLGKD